MPKLRIELEKLVPHPFYEVLSQYYDYEHIEHVHPKSLGRYEMHEQTEDYVAYRQVWPRTLFGQAESIVRHYHDPPNKMRFEFIAGKHKGTIVHTTLHEAEGGTLVHEVYEMNLPNWSWLKPLVIPFVKRSVDHIWNEDLAVEVCHDGWPGIPESMNPKRTILDAQPDVEKSINIPIAELSTERGTLVTLGNSRIAVFRIAEEIHAIQNHCPHTGGPLHLGQIRDGHITCPWHGREFCIKSGRPACSEDEMVHTYRVTTSDGIATISKR